MYALGIDLQPPKTLQPTLPKKIKIKDKNGVQRRETKENDGETVICYWKLQKLTEKEEESQAVMERSRSTKIHLGGGNHYSLAGNIVCALSVLPGIQSCGFSWLPFRLNF